MVARPELDGAADDDGGVTEITPEQVEVSPADTEPGASQEPRIRTPTRGSAARKRIKILTLQEAFEIKRPRFLIQDVLPLGCLALIYGATGSWKTFVALSMAMQIAMGQAWFGHAVTHGPVLYVMAEGISGLRARVMAWTRAPFDDDEHPLWSQFFVVGVPVQVMNGDFDELRKLIADLPEKPVLIVIDTLARCFAGGDESSSRDMGAFVCACDDLREATGATVLVVHHTGWEKPHERGSSSLGGAADARFKVVRTDDRMVFTCDKQKDAPESEAMCFGAERIDLGFDEDGTPMSSLRLVVSDAPTAAVLGARPLPKRQREILAFLVSLSAGNGATVTAIHDGTSTPKATIYTALKALALRGYVEDVKDSSPRAHVPTDAGREVRFS